MYLRIVDTLTLNLSTKIFALDPYARHKLYYTHNSIHMQGLPNKQKGLESDSIFNLDY